MKQYIKTQDGRTKIIEITQKEDLVDDSILQGIKKQKLVDREYFMNKVRVIDAEIADINNALPKVELLAENKVV